MSKNNSFLFELLGENKMKKLLVLCVVLMLAFSATSVMAKKPAPEIPPPEPSGDPLNLDASGFQVGGAGLDSSLRVWKFDSGVWDAVWSSQTDALFWGVQIGDFDNDGAKELAVIRDVTEGKGKNKVRSYYLDIYENGDSNSPSVEYLLSSDDQYTVMTSGDADNDGDSELILLATNVLGVYEYDGSSVSLIWETSTPDMPWSAEVSDPDSDGLNEIVYAGFNNGYFVTYDYLGNGAWGNRIESEKLFLEGSNQYTYMVDWASVGDVDNDNVNEVVVGGSKGNFQVFEFVNGAYVIDFESQDLNGYTQALASADVDDDGLQEIVVGTAGNFNGYYVFEYSGVYQQVFSESTSAGVSSISVGDVDADSVDEVILGGSTVVSVDYSNGYQSVVVSSESTEFEVCIG